MRFSKLIVKSLPVMMLVLVIVMAAGCAGGDKGNSENKDANAIAEQDKPPLVEVTDEAKVAEAETLIAPNKIGGEFADGWKFSAVKAFTDTDLVLELKKEEVESALLVWLTAKSDSANATGKSASLDIVCVVENEKGIPDEFKATAMKVVDLIKANDKGAVVLVARPEGSDKRLDLSSIDISEEPATEESAPEAPESPETDE